MRNMNVTKRSVLGNMTIRQTMGGTRKEDRIRCKDELMERIRKEYERQDTKNTHKLDLTMLDVSKVEDMSNLFLICHGYDLESIDVSNWDMSNVESVESMFFGCNSLENIDVSEWNTNNIKYMGFLFSGCSSLESVDVSDWDVGNVKDMTYMFYGCGSLESIDVSKWNVCNVEDIYGMFYGCNFDYIKKGNKLIDIWRIWTA